MRMSRLLLALTLAGFFGVAQAQNFRDVPAGHWAREAVEFAAQCGLIEGFPDQTYRGNQNLTRYQAALIFFRLFQSQRVENTSPGCRMAMQQAAQNLQPELQALQQRFEALERSNQDRDARMAQLQAEVARAAETARQVQALQERLNTLEQALQRLGQQPAQPNQPAQPSTADLQARIAALEARVNAIASGPTGAYSLAAGNELERKIAVLEEQVRTLTARPAPADQTARVAVLEEQVRTLNTQVGALQNQVNTLRQQPAAQPQPTPQPQPVQPQPQPTPPAPAAPAVRNLYVGAGVSTGLIPSAGFSTANLNLGGMVGLRNLFLGFGLRAGLDYNLGAGGLGAEVFLTRDLNPTGGINPYLGAGARIGLSGGNPLTNTFGTGLVGLDLRFSPALGLFVEATPGVGPATTFSLGARAGLKLSF